MLRLELAGATATLENLNCRTEKIGPDKVPAADLKVSVAVPAEALDKYWPTLKSMLYNENGPRDLADGLPLRDTHFVYPLARDEEMTGAAVKIEFGVGTPMDFEDAKVNQFRITPMEGGTVVIGFRVQCRPDKTQIGQLYVMQEQGITLSITPCALAEMKDAA